MWHLIQRHPFPVRAYFVRSLVLTYAYPEDVLRPLLPPGLTLDTFEGCGFVAIALVQTEQLRPAFLPSLFGQNFFLAGYRIFTRAGQALRGLYILRSDTDRQLMVRTGNLFTHYRYSLCEAECAEKAGTLHWQIRTPSAEADLSVTADLTSAPAPLPAGSPFADLKIARRFAGPLPYTFDYEASTGSIIAVRGLREAWDPQPVRVMVEKANYLHRFGTERPRLANAFYLHDVPYRWESGRKIDDTP